MQRVILTILMTAVSVLPALGDSDECRCRGSDGRIFYEGELACIRTAKGPKLARCEMALNNTTWTIVGDDCPEVLRLSPTRLATFLPVAADSRPAR
jgi:hypothetical protein